MTAESSTLAIASRLFKIGMIMNQADVADDEMAYHSPRSLARALPAHFASDPCQATFDAARAVLVGLYGKTIASNICEMAFDCSEFTSKDLRRFAKIAKAENDAEVARLVAYHSNYEEEEAKAEEDARRAKTDANIKNISDERIEEIVSGMNAIAAGFKDHAEDVAAKEAKVEEAPRVEEARETVRAWGRTDFDVSVLASAIQVISLESIDEEEAEEARKALLTWMNDEFLSVAHLTSLIEAKA